MQPMKSTSTIPLMLLSFAMCLSACATTPPEPPAPDALAVIIMPDPDVQIVQTTARQEGDSVVVNGQVQRKPAQRRTIPKGHVDIAIVDEKGKTLRQIPAKSNPEIIPRLQGMKSTFTARIPIIPPAGSFISVKFHTGSHKD